MYKWQLMSGKSGIVFSIIEAVTASGALMKYRQEIRQEGKEYDKYWEKVNVVDNKILVG